jgi:putative DNA primase/helicase
MSRSVHYNGVGVKVSDQIGFIDIDGCLTDNTLSDIAEQVLTILPEAFAELSPSGTGLHLMFLIPDDFVFDKERYFINNRRVHMEFYILGCTNRFLTVTGNIYRSGNMNVSSAQLYDVLDKFMQRPAVTVAASPVPEGGSILSDAEVMKVAAAAENGDRFMQLYLGEWVIPLS